MPRVCEYLAREFKLDEPTRIKWCQRWHPAALIALEAHLKDAATGRYCHGDAITLADICLASQAAGAKFFAVDTAPFPTFARIAGELSTLDPFARAHPLRQPGIVTFPGWTPSSETASASKRRAGETAIGKRMRLR